MTKIEITRAAGLIVKNCEWYLTIAYFVIIYSYLKKCVVIAAQNTLNFCGYGLKVSNMRHRLFINI